MNKRITVTFPNEGEAQLSIESIKKWIPTICKTVDKVTFFEVDNVMLSMSTEDYQKIWGSTLSQIDNWERTCSSCGIGNYKETFQLDDLKGILHCKHCGKEISRYENT